jgi:hypothetical protein
MGDEQYTKWRGEQAGSRKEHNFRIDGNDKSKIYVFESPIDVISHASTVNHYKGAEAWRENTRLSLGGVTDNALIEYLKNNLDTKEIVFCLDNDEAGHIATAKLSEKYSQLGYSVRTVTPKNKDFNEDLLYLRNCSNTAQNANKITI